MANGTTDPLDSDYIDAALMNTPKGLRISLQPVSRGTAISPRLFLLDIHCARGLAKTFRSVSPEGMDIYDLEFEHGRVEARIAPLTPDGKVQLRGFSTPL